ncbi:hypothetical protein FOVG_01398 [Fusarium oxysporum f. sp. pisi HDV247]|uniref:MalT-like TPR region domain-containing protein n=1 Tax=Fusarium oxysporum f. sp. pisi HDV247 TaxID=1080344 RepID=W9Q7Z2_FUSOX|nr:hypothetical protein FOVG_01398 [Fusarium oxysporum f. sp. pisi HDV247]
MLFRGHLRKTCIHCRRSYRLSHTCYGVSRRSRISSPEGDTTFETIRWLDFGGPPDTRQIIDLRPALDANDVHRFSISLRLKGSVFESIGVLCQFLSGNELPQDVLAPLHLSQANNYMYLFAFDEAHKEIQQWKPPANLLESQENLLWDQLICVGRVLKGSGDFQAAQRVLQVCCETPGLPNHKRALAISMLADTLCELWAIKKEIYCLEMANSWVEFELSLFTKPRNPLHRGLRRLLLSHLEVKICLGRRSEAINVAQELVTIYGQLDELDINDRLGHVRTLIALARLARPSEDSLQRWEEVLRQNHLYNPNEEEVYTCGIVYSILAKICRDPNRSLQYAHKADQVLRCKQRQFLIPGIGTYISDTSY